MTNPRGIVVEDHVVVADPARLELCGVVFGLVEPHMVVKPRLAKKIHTVMRAEFAVGLSVGVDPRA